MKPLEIDELTYYKAKANRLAAVLSQEIDHSAQLEILIESLTTPKDEDVPPTSTDS
jgi:hypothetical protein